MKIITRSILILSIVSLLNDISSEMLYPVMPVFLSKTRVQKQTGAAISGVFAGGSTEPSPTGNPRSRFDGATKKGCDET